jgi:hypothetical protein
VTERQPGSDLIGELQRWLVRSGARGVSRELGDQVRTVLGSNSRADVWESATADYEAPECQWCPICRARRRLRESGPGLSSTVAAAGDAASTVLQDAVAAFEAAVAVAGRQARPRDDAPADGEVWDEVTEEPPSGGVWDEATDGPARPLPRLVPDPPAGAAEPGETVGAAGASELGETAGAAEAPAEPGETAGPPAGSSGPAGPHPEPFAPPGPGE